MREEKAEGIRSLEPAEKREGEGWSPFSLLAFFVPLTRLYGFFPYSRTEST